MEVMLSSRTFGAHRLLMPTNLARVPAGSSPAIVRSAPRAEFDLVLWPESLVTYSQAATPVEGVEVASRASRLLRSVRVNFHMKGVAVSS
jgi:hypothetical protein